MPNEDKSPVQFIQIIENLAKLHEWESKNFPLLNSLAGRILYFRISQRVIGNFSDLSGAMKELIGDSSLTEKALRNRLKKMKTDGYLSFEKSLIDERFKPPIPNEKFHAAMYLHAGQAMRIFEEDFILIKK